MNVSLSSTTSDYIINKLYTAARTCYSNESPEVIFRESIHKSNEEMMKTIMHCMKSGHHSILEHVSFTFYISGVSRALTHQLVRHRLASYSQQSQRYCKLDGDSLNFVTPNTIEQTPGALERYTTCITFIKSCYDSLLKMGIPAEDARYLLPNATCTNITMSLNLRELIHLFNERSCRTAQWEIRQLMWLIKLQVEPILGPELMEYLTPKCIALGYCPESKKRSCGIRKTREEVVGS